MNWFILHFPWQINDQLLLMGSDESWFEADVIEGGGDMLVEGSACDGQGLCVGLHEFECKHAFFNFSSRRIIQ